MISLSKRWNVVFLLLPFLNIYYFNLQSIKPIILIWQCLLIVILLAFAHKYINLFNLWLIIYTLIILFSSIINGTITFGIIFSLLMLVVICIFITIALKNSFEFIRGLYFLYVSTIVINFIMMLLYPTGISKSSDGLPLYLLGGKNAIQIVVLMVIPIVFLYSYKKFNKIKYTQFAIILICILSMYISNSGNGIVLSIIFCVFIFLYKKLPVIPFKIYLLSYVFIYFSIVIFRIQNIFFGSFIENVLNKDLTFTSRTYIWDLILHNIMDFWILGLGKGNSFIQDNFYLNLSEAHNGILEIILSSGILGLFSFLIILVLVQKKLDLYRQHIISRVLSFSIFAYLILGLTESVFSKIEFWILLVISYNVEKIINQFDKNTKLN